MGKKVTTGVAEDRRKRRVYAFLEAVTRPDLDDRYARMDIVLDAVDAGAFDRFDSDIRDRDPRHLSIIRVLTTPNRFFDCFNIRPPESEGAWFEVDLSPEPGQPPAWILDAAADYGTGVVRTNVVGFRPLDESSGPALPSSLVDGLSAWCAIAYQAGAQAADRVRPIVEFGSFHIRVLDVGHAACSAIHLERDVDSRIIGYYDVGGPVFFHRRTFPKRFGERSRVPARGFVILSHWDFDHYSLAVTDLTVLQQLDWYAPDQTVGPNAARLQVRLGSRLNVLTAPRIPIRPGLNLWKGSGTASNRNDSGYVLRASRGPNVALLTGDVSYDAISAAAKRRLRAVAVPHHGGAGCANPPVPSGPGRAVVSYGVPNRYGHPDARSLGAHTSVGWTLARTATFGPAGRGDIWLL